MKESHKNVPLVDQYQGMKQYLKSICSTVLYLRTCEPRHPRICQSGKRCKAEEKCMLFTDMNEELCVPKDYCRPFLNTKDDCEEGYYCSNTIGKCVPNVTVATSRLVKIDPKSRPGPRIKWIICRSNRDCPKGYWCPRPPGICAPLPWG